MYEKNGSKIVTIRIPVDVCEKVKAMANKDRRSFSAMVAVLLDKACENA